MLENDDLLNWNHVIRKGSETAEGHLLKKIQYEWDLPTSECVPHSTCVQKSLELECILHTCLYH
jgi:hypothetical protein